MTQSILLKWNKFSFSLKIIRLIFTSSIWPILSTSLMVSLGIQLNCLFSLPEMIAFLFPRIIYLNFSRSFPVHLENYPECVLRTIGWARGPWEDTSYQYLLGNFKDGERTWLSMLKLYLKRSFIQSRAKCNESLWIMPRLWLPVWLQCRPYRMSLWTNVQIF